jgi:hypothetical protein
MNGGAAALAARDDYDNGAAKCVFVRPKLNSQHHGVIVKLTFLLSCDCPCVTFVRNPVSDTL